MIPDPVPGLVVCYAYLWSSEGAAGLEEGRKDRPCAVVLAQRWEDGDIVVYVAPVTHSAPRAGTFAVRVPDVVKRQLGLDAERSWIVCDEVNRFVWPGADLRPVQRDTPGRFDFGTLPRPLVTLMLSRLLTARRAGRLRIADRTP